MANKNTFYSQHGEDYIASLILPSYNGFFIEVDCIDGKRFSNTLFFANKGWKGLCIEAHNDYIKMLHENRQESTIEHSAVGESDEENVNFYANSRGSLSTLDQTQEARFKESYAKYFSGHEIQQVRKRTLNSILAENNIKDIDFLSLDIEGYELKALEGLDFNIYRPRLIAVEYDTPEYKIALEKVILGEGYNFLFSLASNLFFLREDLKFDANLLSKRTKIQLTHTEHPLDNDGDKIVNLYLQKEGKNIVTSHPGIINNLKRILKKNFKK